MFILWVLQSKQFKNQISMWINFVRCFFILLLPSYCCIIWLKGQLQDDLLGYKPSVCLKYWCVYSVYVCLMLVLWTCCVLSLKKKSICISTSFIVKVTASYLSWKHSASCSGMISWGSWSISDYRNNCSSPLMKNNSTGLAIVPVERHLKYTLSVHFIIIFICYA